MKMRDRIKKAIQQRYKGIDGLVAVAYWIGKHDGAKEVCDKHKNQLENMRKAANACRYHKMVNKIIGKSDTIYHADYSSDFPDWDDSEIM